MITRKIAGLLAAAAFSLAAFTAHAEKRVALVIGNAAYVNTPALSNPVNDAEDMAAALERVGFKVQIERDLTKRGMEGALARFARSAEDADAALFFYAGHGIQYRGTNFLMPVDARLDDDIGINYELLRIDDVLFGLERTRGVKLMVLDACRNNPLLDRLLRRNPTRGTVMTRGLARIEAARGMVVAYSTQADQVAVDGTGRNSPFTEALVKYIDEPGLEVGSLFRRVAIEVDRATGGRQLPELSITLRGEFYLNSRESDLQAWSKIHASDDPSLLADFIRRYPNSTFAAEVRRRLDLIERDRADRTRVERDRTERERLERERIERERVAREPAERQARDAAARELARLQAERDGAERARAERERVEKERIAQQQAARERDERERVAREHAERQAREAAARELARQQAERAEAARGRERVENERIAREQAERERLTPAPAAESGPRIAMLPPATEPAASTLTGAALVREIKKELKRVGCHAGAVDDSWSTPETKRSVQKFVRSAKLASEPDAAATDFLDAIRRTGPRVCPLECGARQIEKGGACIARTCPRGHVLTRDGDCEDRRPKARTAARTPAAESVEPNPSRRQREGAPSGGSGQQAVICGNRGCRTGSWSQVRTPGQRCRRVFNNRHQLFCH